MKSTRLITVLATSLVLMAFGTGARAAGGDDFAVMFSLAQIDGCVDGKKDGMVSKAEFMTMMEKAWASKAKEMNVGGDKMSTEDFKKLMGWFSRGEKN
jgi:hypothetical protein